MQMQRQHQGVGGPGAKLSTAKPWQMGSLLSFHTYQWQETVAASCALNQWKLANSQWEYFYDSVERDLFGMIPSAEMGWSH